MTEIQNMTSDAELADIAAMLGDLDLSEADVLEVEAIEADALEAGTIIEPDETLSPEEIDEIEQVAEIVELDLAALDEDIEGAVAQIELTEARQSAYDAQEVVEGDAVLTAPEASEPAEVIAAEAAPAKAAKAPKVAKTPKVPGIAKAPRLNVSDLPNEAFMLDATVDPDDASAMASLKLDVLAKRPAQVKVAEKFDNILLAVNAGKLPSTYTVDCYQALKASGETTSAGLAAALSATTLRKGGSTYTIGTARSQAGQFMALAPALRIATREGNKLILNPDSLIAAALDALMGA